MDLYPCVYEKKRNFYPRCRIFPAVALTQGEVSPMAAVPCFKKIFQQRKDMKTPASGGTKGLNSVSRGNGFLKAEKIVSTFF